MRNTFMMPLLAFPFCIMACVETSEPASTDLGRTQQLLTTNDGKALEQADQHASDENQSTPNDSEQSAGLSGTPDKPGEAVAVSAFSGGGCTGAFPVSSCISGSGSSARGDFYLNASIPVGGDPSRYWYQIEVTRSNLGSWWDPRGLRRLDHSGHYDAVFAPIFTMPPTNGCARTVVHVYTNTFGTHGTFASPSLCY
jgi:hypothetical protein